MPTINPSLVPTVAPGNLFAALTGDTTLNVRWITPTDPVYYEAMNRPMADITLRQLILAKTLDSLSISIGHEAIFPFLVQAKVMDSTTNVQLPNGWIWDLHMSTPAKWQDFRLAKIKRESGTNAGSTGTYTGTLRLIFTATSTDSSTETALFYADYIIDSNLTYQRSRLTVCTTTEEAVCIDASESETIKGFITFRTLLQDDVIVQAFYNLVAPGSSLPTTYQIVSTGATPTEITSFNDNVISHGTGMLVDSCNNAIPNLSSDTSSWLNAFNYPFDVDASRTSNGTFVVTIPSGMFREFNIVAPAGDEPTGDTTGTYFPVWISRIQPIGTANNQLRIYFATHNVTRLNPSPDAVEFARLDLLRSMVSGEIVAIEPIDDLLLHTGTDDELYYQDFGRGHVVLSSEWGGTSTTIDDFFDAFNSLLTDQYASFIQTTTRISAFGVSRVPRFTPTDGQCRAMVGTTDSLTTPIPPSETNRFVCEQDQGLGNTINLNAQEGIVAVDGISCYGYTGGLVRRTVQLCIDYTKLPEDTDTEATAFYEEYILPRLVILLGRSPLWGDEWYNGTTFLRFNGDTWQSI
ncbi:MAG: hypothetical protein M0R50_03185 [Candidatus Cloacimonetes bacterium]|jgi:hypothetical protein|nr:hypothetical protein [Candidatus Cloacimonadota bacterium]